MKLFTITALMLASPAFAQVAPAVPLVVPIDVVQLVQVTLAGLSAVLGGVAAIYAIWAKVRADAAVARGVENAREIKAVSTQIDGLLVQRDAAKVKEGGEAEKIKGDERAATLAEGQQQGRDAALASAAAASLAATAAAGSVLSAQGKAPVAVEDERTAEAAEAALSVAKRSATAQESMADAAQAAKLKGK